jgi:hypothetical protein
MDESAPAMNPLSVAIMQGVQVRTLWRLDLIRWSVKRSTSRFGVAPSDRISENA